MSKGNPHLAVPCERGLPGFRGDLPEWSYQQAFHAKGTRRLQILTRYWWPRLVATIGQSGGHGAIDHVTWIDAPGDRAEKHLRLRGSRSGFGDQNRGVYPSRR